MGTLTRYIPSHWVSMVTISYMSFGSISKRTFQSLKATIPLELLHFWPAFKSSLSGLLYLNKLPSFSKKSSSSLVLSLFAAKMSWASFKSTMFPPRTWIIAWGPQVSHLKVDPWKGNKEVKLKVINIRCTSDIWKQMLTMASAVCIYNLPYSAYYRRPHS